MGLTGLGLSTRRARPGPRRAGGERAERRRRYRGALACRAASGSSAECFPAWTKAQRSAQPPASPTLYPVACSPQAWSAAAVFLLVQACLGLAVSAPERQLCFSYPQLPEFLRELHVTDLRVGEAVLDLRFLRHGQDVGIHVLRREGDCGILTVR